MKNREEFLIFCAGFVRLPYIWGGSKPKVGLDCSGLSQVLLAFLGLDPSGDQTAQNLKDELIARGGKIIPVEEADLGDQVFFGPRDGKISHVATCLNNKQMIEAAGGGPWCTNIQVAMEHEAYTKISSIFRRNDRVCVVRPANLEWGA